MMMHGFANFRNVGRDVFRPLSAYVLTTRRHKPSDCNLNSFLHT